MNVRVHDDLFVTTGGVPLASVSSGQEGLLVQHDAYGSSGADSRIVTSGATSSDVPSWRAATGHEQRGGVATGVRADPRLTDPGGGAVIGNGDRLTTSTAYRLEAESPLIDAGLDLGVSLELAPSLTDFYGGVAPQGGGYDIGAHEGRRACELTASSARASEV